MLFTTLCGIYNTLCYLQHFVLFTTLCVIYNNKKLFTKKKKHYVVFTTIGLLHRDRHQAYMMVTHKAVRFISVVGILLTGWHGARLG